MASDEARRTMVGRTQQVWENKPHRLARAMGATWIDGGLDKVADAASPDPTPPRVRGASRTSEEA